MRHSLDAVVLKTWQPVDTDEEREPDYADVEPIQNQQQWMAVTGLMPHQGATNVGLGLRDLDMQFDWAAARQN